MTSPEYIHRNIKELYCEVSDGISSFLDSLEDSLRVISGRCLWGPLRDLWELPYLCKTPTGPLERNGDGLAKN
jgi:hypothetical protein